ncbi:MAG: Redox-sensing transcriptional repressor Rex [Actinomycetota bacterium]|jgi:redox-sensing transcriptional repressor|nr:Redox-sensing transcriptional repressor Rex [Actinomycetota bacterium]
MRVRPASSPLIFPWSTVSLPVRPAGSPADRRRPRDQHREIPDATVARLPVYHRVLGQLADSGVTTVSSEELAGACGVSSAKLRKDLSHLGSYGTRGVGYDVRFLAYQISRELGLTQPWGVVIVGAGNLGHALVAYRGFASRGFEIVGLLDSHPDVVGQRLGTPGREVAVCPMAELESVVATGRAHIGVIATPAEAAQGVCDRLVAAGVRSILNFAPVVLAVPEDVEVRKVDLAVELQILAFHEQRRSEEHEPRFAHPSSDAETSFDPESLGEAINA